MSHNSTTIERYLVFDLRDLTDFFPNRKQQILNSSHIKLGKGVDFDLKKQKNKMTLLGLHSDKQVYWLQAMLS